MNTAIKSLPDVQSFFLQLIYEESLNFHPDEDFQNYINLKTMLPTYTEEEALIRNKLMKQAFAICEKLQADIYQIGADILFKHLDNKIHKS